MPKAKRSTDAAVQELRAFGLKYPGAHLKSPWPGHKDLAVNDKTFAYLSIEGAPMSVSCKLPHSSGTALMLPFCSPTPYGLGKSGWVSADFEDETQAPPVELFKQWIDESYRAQAPKKFVKQLDAGASSAPARSSSQAATKSKPAKKAAVKKAVNKKAAAKRAPAATKKRKPVLKK